MTRSTTVTRPIDLGVGAPDIPTPGVAAEAAIQAIADGHTRYAGAAGIGKLRDRIADRFAKDKNISVSPDDIIVSAGAKLTLFCVLSALARPASNVVFAAPHYAGYPHLIRRAGLEGRPVQTNARDSYRLEPSQLAAAVDRSTVAVVLNAPSNPTGTTYTKHELEELCEVIRSQSNALIVSDEIYSAFSYDAPFVSVASLDSVHDRVVVVDGVSKAYGMSGWRVGYAAGPRDVIARARQVNTQLTNCACTISQHAAAAALNLPPEECADIPRHRKSRDLAFTLASRIPGVTVTKPGGGIYQSIQLNDTQMDALRRHGQSVTEALLTLADVKLPQDVGFGRPGLLRITFSLPDEQLREGLNRLHNLLASL